MKSDFGTFSLPAARRLKSRQEFLQVRDRGRLLRAPHFIVQALPRPDSFGRLGLTVSRKVGNAPCRNRVKRRLRELYRLEWKNLLCELDVVVIARRGAERLSLDDMRRELGPLLASFGHSD